jgi:cell division protein FtsB
MQQFNQFLPLINILGLFGIGLGIMYAQFKTGGNKVSSDVISAYKDRVDQLITENTALREQIGTIQQDISALRATITEKERSIGQLTAVLQGKDPTQIEYMDKMEKLAESATAYMKRSDEREDKIFQAIKDVKK